MVTYKGRKLISYTDTKAEHLLSKKNLAKKGYGFMISKKEFGGYALFGKKKGGNKIIWIK